MTFNWTAQEEELYAMIYRRQSDSINDEECRDPESQIAYVKPPVS